MASTTSKTPIKKPTSKATSKSKLIPKKNEEPKKVRPGLEKALTKAKSPAKSSTAKPLVKPKKKTTVKPKEEVVTPEKSKGTKILDYLQVLDTKLDDMAVRLSGMESNLSKYLEMVNSHDTLLHSLMDVTFELKDAFHDISVERALSVNDTSDEINKPIKKIRFIPRQMLYKTAPGLYGTHKRHYNNLLIKYGVLDTDIHQVEGRLSRSKRARQMANKLGRILHARTDKITPDVWLLDLLDLATLYTYHLDEDGKLIIKAIEETHINEQEDDNQGNV